jgi:hypothetical protein
MEKKRLERYYLIACFMIFLVVSIPIAASHAYASASIEELSVSGEDGIEGYKSLEDSTVMQATIKLDPGTNITPDRIRSLESGLTFNTCENYGAAAVCLYERADYPTTSGVTRDIIVGVYDSEGHLDDSVARKLTIDNQPPLVYVTNVEQTTDSVLVTLDVKDTSCVESSCDQVNTPCSGVKDINLFSGVSTTIKPSIHISTYSADFNLAPSGEYCKTPLASSVDLVPEEGSQFVITPNKNIQVKIVDPETIGDGWHTISASATDHIGNVYPASGGFEYQFDFSEPTATELTLYKHFATGSEVAVDYVKPSPVSDVVAIIRIQDDTLEGTTNLEKIRADFSSLFEGPSSIDQSNKQPYQCIPGPSEDIWDCLFATLSISLSTTTNVEVPVTIEDARGNVGTSTLFYTINIDSSQPFVDNIESRYVSGDSESGNQCWRNNCFLKPGNNTIVVVVDEQSSGMDSHYVIADLSEVEGDNVGHPAYFANGAEARAVECISNTGRWDCMYPVGVIRPNGQLDWDETMPSLIYDTDLDGRKTYYLDKSPCLVGTDDSPCVDEELLGNYVNHDVLIEQYPELVDSGDDGIILAAWLLNDVKSNSDKGYVEVGMINDFLGPLSDAYLEFEAGTVDESVEGSGDVSLPDETDYLSHVYVHTIEGYDDAEQPLLNDERTFVYDAMPPKLIGVDAVVTRSPDASEYADVEGVQNIILEGDGLDLLFYFEEDYYLPDSGIYLNLTNPEYESRSLIYEYNNSNVAIQSPEECRYLDSLDQWMCKFRLYDVENTVYGGLLGESGFTLHVSDAFGNYADFKFGAQVFAFNKSLNLSSYSQPMFTFNVREIIPRSIDRRTTVQLSQKLMAYVNVSKNYLASEKIDIVRGGISLVPGCPSNPVFITEEDMLFHPEDEGVSEGTTSFNSFGSFNANNNDNESNVSTEDIMSISFDSVIEDVKAFGLIYDERYNYSDFSLFIRTIKQENTPDISHVILNCSFDVLAVSKTKGVFFPKQTFDMKFNINMSHDPITDDVSEALVEKLKEEVDFLGDIWDVIYILNYIIKILKTVCELGGVMSLVYKAMMTVRYAVMPFMIIIYNLLKKYEDVTGGQTHAKNTQMVWDQINVMACRAKQGKMAFWMSETERSEIIKPADEGGGGGSYGGTDYGSFGTVASDAKGGGSMFNFEGGSREAEGEGDGETGFSSIMRSICGVVTCAQCTAEDDIGQNAQGVFENFMHDPAAFITDVAGDDDENSPYQGGADVNVESDSTKKPNNYKIDNQGAPWTDKAYADKPGDEATGGDYLKAGAQNFGASLVDEAFNDGPIDPFKDFGTAVMCWCIPGIIHNLNKLRQIDCKFLRCAYDQSISANGIHVCEQIRSFEVCLAWMGPIFSIVPYMDVVSKVMALAAMFAHSWPLMIIEVITKVLLACNQVDPTEGEAANVEKGYQVAQSHPDCFVTSGTRKGEMRVTWPLGLMNTDAEGEDAGEGWKIASATICGLWDTYLFVSSWPHWADQLASVDYWLGDMNFFEYDYCEDPVVTKMLDELGGSFLHE